ncbi:hypothetical protein PMAYCL1PPCAC_17430, partial [Pristionchus mayeri]
HSLTCPSTDQMEESRSCLVCSKSILSIHLGIDICRACASFFKRAKKTGKVYPCRQGTGKCQISRESKFTCRRCRFDQCVSVGAVYDGPMRVRANPPAPHLERIEKEFKLMIKRRRIREEEFMKSFPHNVKIPHPKETIYVMSAVSSVDLYLITSEESMTFIDKVFPVLNRLSAPDKDSLCKDYIVKLHIIVSYYLTQKLFGDLDKKMMSSVVTCYDTEIPFDYYYPEDKGNKEFFER